MIASKMDQINNKFTEEYTELSRTGSGAFGGVFRVKSNKDQQIYAVKKIAFKVEDKHKILTAITLLYSLDSKFMVKFYESWIENNYYINPEVEYEEVMRSDGFSLLPDPQKPLLFHLRMEYCSLSVDTVMNTTDASTPLGYYIMSELLKDMLQCLNYLHEHNPPLVHCDLKPTNFLLSNQFEGRFIKLADFNLSTIQEFQYQSFSSRIGFRTYMAPEMSNGKSFTTKADIYSLGMLMQKMFRFNINDEIEHNLFPEKFQCLLNLVIETVAYRAADRPTCHQMLEKKDVWLLNRDDINSETVFADILNNTPKAVSIEENFEEFFVQSKLSGV